MKVQDPDKRFNAVATDWALIDALYGGTKTMRAAGEVYLPRETAEAQLQYTNRLKRSFLYGALRNTINKVVAKPFTKPVVVEGGSKTTDMPNITRFARMLFTDAVKYNEAFFLVEYPKTAGAMSVADEAKLQPYFVRIHPKDMLEASDEMLRYKYSVDVRDGAYGTKEVQRIRVVTATTWEVHENIKEDVWNKVEEGTHSFGSIPLVEIELEDSLPFEDLAYTNLAHWQSNSDQRNILRFARMPLLYQFGVSLEEAETPIIFGPAQCIRSTNADASMGYVEHTGKAIESGDRDLQNLVAEMEILGLQPMLRKSGNTTATAKSIDEGKQQTAVQTWAGVLEAALQLGMEHALAWKNETAEVKVRVHTEFALSLKAESDIKELREMYKMGAIAVRTFLFEVKRRGFFDEEFNVDKEAALLDA